MHHPVTIEDAHQGRNLIKAPQVGKAALIASRLSPKAEAVPPLAAVNDPAVRYVVLVPSVNGSALQAWRCGRWVDPAVPAFAIGLARDWALAISARVKAPGRHAAVGPAVVLSGSCSVMTYVRWRPIVNRPRPRATSSACFTDLESMSGR